MDIPRARQRSASHSSLHNSYRLNMRPTTGSLTVRPSSRRPPLRSVNENSAMLRSPGPLESMLKTTTETGDIGVFSIKLGSSSSSSSHRPPSRGRPYLGNGDASLLQSARQYTEQPCSDGNRRLRPYRDTTSEIISLYGSDNQQYWLRSSSPPFDDAHRSYSLTTCSSRHVASQKSSGTLQSHSSSSGSGGMQRPRSPFPYPTRLKRPGVRSASPALAENGGVDYSRMSELDRVSQRTVQGSYKPTFTSGTRRPPPLSLRSDVNRSTKSLPSRGSPGSCHFGPGTYCSRTPSSSLSGLSKPGDPGRGSSTDPSVRSASLTSIVEMYQRPTTTNSAISAFRSGGSFYYDYSEAFEKPAPLKHKPESQVPVCPIPMRPGSQIQAMVLRDGTQAEMNGIPQSIEPQYALNLQEGEHGSSAPATEEALQEYQTPIDKMSARSISDIADEAESALINDNESDSRENEHDPHSILGGKSERNSSIRASTVSEACVTSIHAYATPQTIGSALRHEKSPASRTAWRSSKTLDADEDGSESVIARRVSQSSLTKPPRILDPAPSDFASLLSSINRVARTSLPSSDELEPMAVIEGASRDESDHEYEDFGFPKRLGRRPSLHLFNVLAAESLARRRRHRRNAAALRISTAALTNEESREAISTPSPQIVDIVSPKPISPMRQLKVKNSIPRLMKALPPLPGEAAVNCPARSDQNMQLGEPNEFEGEGAPTSELSDHEEGELPPTHSLYSTPEVEVENEKTTEQGGNEHHPLIAGIKPRLKLKLSRSKLGQARAGVNCKPFWGNRLKQCNSLADLATTPRCIRADEQVFAIDQVSEARMSAIADEDMNDGEEDDLPSPQLSDQFNIPYPPSPEGSYILRPLSTSTDKDTLCEMRSFISERNQTGRRGLRQKLSILRLRITGGLANECVKKTAIAATLVAQEGPMDLEAQDQWDAKNDVKGVRKVRVESVSSEKTGGRVRRWASDAKQAVRLYVRRTLDRSSRLSS